MDGIAVTGSGEIALRRTVEVLKTATAWINGKALPLRQVGVDQKGVPILGKGAAPMGRPWEFVATDALQFGKPNTLVVRVTNRVVNELGTGGITGPAMLWAQARAEGK